MAVEPSTAAEHAAVKDGKQIRRTLIHPRFDQSLAPSSGNGSSITTMSHARTLPGTDQGGTEHEFLGSVYSYNSTRDISRFVRELHGRSGSLISASHSILPAPV